MSQLLERAFIIGILFGLAACSQEVSNGSTCNIPYDWPAVGITCDRMYLDGAWDVTCGADSGGTFAVAAEFSPVGLLPSWGAPIYRADVDFGPVGEWFRYDVDAVSVAGVPVAARTGFFQCVTDECLNDFDHPRLLDMNIETGNPADLERPAPEGPFSTDEVRFYAQGFLPAVSSADPVSFNVQFEGRVVDAYPGNRIEGTCRWSTKTDDDVYSVHEGSGRMEYVTCFEFHGDSLSARQGCRPADGCEWDPACNRCETQSCRESKMVRWGDCWQSPNTSCPEEAW